MFAIVQSSVAKLRHAIWFLEHDSLRNVDLVSKMMSHFKQLTSKLVELYTVKKVSNQGCNRVSLLVQGT